MKQRVFAAIIKDGSILMVQHQHDGRVYWTLPGGGVEPDETLEEAVTREVREETCLHAAVKHTLFTEGTSTCFLLDCEDTKAVLGYDPELGPENQMLTAVGWFSLEAVANDIQVSKVLGALDKRSEYQ